MEDQSEIRGGQARAAEEGAKASQEGSGQTRRGSKRAREAARMGSSAHAQTHSRARSPRALARRKTARPTSAPHHRGLRARRHAQ
eukprot:6199167-Pleurochrysis_carterae.AAC.1